MKPRGHWPGAFICKNYWRSVKTAWALAIKHGSGVATPAHIRAVAARVARAYQQGEKIAVVASAMGKSTDQLIALASQVGENICPREMDALMATGEQKTISLLAMAPQNLGVPAMSFTGAQCGMLTNTNHSRAKILQIKADAVEACVAAGKVPVVAGFQGVSQDGSITTLGRGGSDTTAVALAAALGWDCQIYTDVDSIFTADPRKCPGAKPLHRVTYEEMMEMASLGAGVLETRSVELAKKYGVKLYLGRSLEEDLRKGTYIMEWNETFEDMPVTGLSIKENCAMFTIDGLAPDGSGVSRIFELVAELDVNVDMISQQTLPSGVLASFSCSEADAKLLLGRMETGGFPRQPASGDPDQTLPGGGGNAYPWGHRRRRLYRLDPGGHPLLPGDHLGDLYLPHRGPSESGQSHPGIGGYLPAPGRPAGSPAGVTSGRHCRQSIYQFQ